MEVNMVMMKIDDLRQLESDIYYVMYLRESKIKVS